MTITKDKAVFLRGEGSGTERLELMLSDGRGCIEFMRILLDLALAEKIDLGHNPDVVLEGKEQSCTAKNVTHHSMAFKAATSKATLRRTKKVQACSVPDFLSRVATSEAGSEAPLASALPRSTPAVVCQRTIVSSSTSSKRVHSGIPDDGDNGTQSKKRKIDESVVVEVNRFVFFPVVVYDYSCLFTVCSIRGRGTTVSRVVALKDKDNLLALKIAVWQNRMQSWKNR